MELKVNLSTLLVSPHTLEDKVNCKTNGQHNQYEGHVLANVTVNSGVINIQLNYPTTPPSTGHYDVLVQFKEELLLFSTYGQNYFNPELENESVSRPGGDWLLIKIVLAIEEYLVKDVEILTTYRLRKILMQGLSLS